MTTQADIRDSFWATFPEYVRQSRKTQNDYNATIRTLFVEYVDTLARNGAISKSLASRVTL